MSDFTNFKKMVTPALIKVLFWVGVVACVLGGLVALFGGEFLSGLLTILVGPLIVRVYCELLIVIFAINDTLTDIKNLLAGRP